jgi:2-(1,2-epoxy-1,2-dihydrophenyl)acetyl-CoA isomerase
MNYETLLVERAGHVARITLNRPQVLNSFNAAMLAELRAAIEAAGRDETARCVVLTGAGRAFCAGQDLAELQDGYERGTAPDLGRLLRDRYHPVILGIRHLEKPVVAAVNGIAAGAGCSLALACDLILASERATFAEAFVQVGLVPDAGSTFFLPRLIGFGRALELALTGRSLDAAEAERLGLVTRVVPPDTLEAEAAGWAERLAQAPARAVGLIKRALNRSLTNDLPAQLDLEAACQAEAGQTADHLEAVRAFLEKRKPTFIGR